MSNINITDTIQGHTFWGFHGSVWNSVYVRSCVCEWVLMGVWKVAVGGNEQSLRFHSNILTLTVSMATDNSIS